MLIRTSSLKEVFLGGWGFIAWYPVAVPHAGNEKQHKKENPTYHSANSVASGRGKGMVRICCVHPAITEEREKRYKKKKKVTWEGQSNSCLTTGNGSSSMPLHTHVCIHAHTGTQAAPLQRDPMSMLPCIVWDGQENSLPGGMWHRPWAWPAGKRSAPLKCQLVHPLPLGNCVMQLGTRGTAGTSTTGTVTAAEWKQWGILHYGRSITFNVLGLKHGLTAQAMKNLKASTLIKTILFIYSQLHAKAS